MKRIALPLLALPLLLTGVFAAPEDVQAGQSGNFGEYKIKINATNAEKWKAKWLCNESNGTTTTIDSDTYPASTSTTRSTNITASKCSTGNWKVAFYIKVGGNWRAVKPGASVCGDSSSCGFRTDGLTYKQYLRPDDYPSGSKKICLKGWNFSYSSIYLTKHSC